MTLAARLQKGENGRVPVNQCGCACSYFLPFGVLAHNSLRQAWPRSGDGSPVTAFPLHASPNHWDNSLPAFWALAALWFGGATANPDEDRHGCEFGGNAESNRSRQGEIVENANRRAAEKP
jgi:hypothetical protein